MSVNTQPRPPSIVGRVTRAIARASAPISRPLAGRRYLRLWAIVRHRGRRSGRSYAAPVAIRATSDEFVIPLPWGDRTQWLRNVQSAGGCTVSWNGAEHVVRAPRVVALDDAIAAFHPIQRAILRAAGVRSVLRVSRATKG